MSARKRYKVTSLLIAKGADIARKDTEGGRSALTMAASEGAADTLELLLDSGRGNTIQWRIVSGVAIEGGGVGVLLPPTF